MLSLHHIVHSICVVVIALLLKKYMELTSLHKDLVHEYEQLRQTCLRTSHSVCTNREVQCAPCPCARGHHFVQSQTGVKSSTLQDDKGMLGLTANQQPAHLPTSETRAPDSEGSADYFGRTFRDTFASDPNHMAGKSREETTSTDFKQITPSRSYISSENSYMISSGVPPKPEDPIPGRAHQPSNKETDSNVDSVFSFQKTSESLEKITVSPSSSFLLNELNFKVTDIPEDALPDGLDESSYDEFYEGSREKFADSEIEVIVTDIGDRYGKPIHYQTQEAETLQDAMDDLELFEDMDMEEDMTEMEEPHPAFGKVKLKELSASEVDELSTLGSSARCTGASTSDRICWFTNLCFKPTTREFVFLLSPRSVHHNVPSLKPQEALLELSSIAGHNAQFFSYTTIPASSLKNSQVVLMTGTTVVFRRFKPDNIMHVLHDDIIPLFYTLLSHNLKPEHFPEGKKFPVSLFLSDENNEGEFYHLYEAFAAGSTFTANSLVASVSQSGVSADAMVCFSETHVGVSKATTWYQYGFFEPQGAIPESAATSDHIRSVGSFLLSGFVKDCLLCGEGGHLVLISRKETRRILNEMELVMALSKTFRVKVMTVSLDTQGLEDIISIVHTSLGIIGMHGSLLSLAAFLRPGSIVIELFPYAINPIHYTPYKTLSRLPGMFLAYRAWANQDKERSVMHPHWSKDFGGMQHLAGEKRKEIMLQTEVPPHLCCEDPSWLFHIFQDTHIDIKEVLAVVSAALSEARPWRMFGSNPPSLSHATLPGPPQHLKCRLEILRGRASLHLEWRLPWNAHYFEASSIDYSVQVQEASSGRTIFSRMCDVLKLVVREGVVRDTQYRVWVGSVVNGRHGPFGAVSLCSAV